MFGADEEIVELVSIGVCRKFGLNVRTVACIIQCDIRTLFDAIVSLSRLGDVIAILIIATLIRIF